MEQKKSEYRCWLYKRENGETKSQIYVGQEAVDAAMENGWHDTFAVFIDESSDLTDGQKATAVGAANYIQGDMNVLANCDNIDDFELLKDAFNRLMEKPLHNNVTTLEGIRKIIHRRLKDKVAGTVNEGDDGDSTDVH